MGVGYHPIKHKHVDIAIPTCLNFPFFLVTRKFYQLVKIQGLLWRRNLLVRCSEEYIKRLTFPQPRSLCLSNMATASIIRTLVKSPRKKCSPYPLKVLGEDYPKVMTGWIKAIPPAISSRVLIPSLRYTLYFL